MKTEYMLNKEVEHVLAALTPANALACRVSLRTGLRIGDVLSLRPEQLAARFWVTEGKTCKRRIVGLNKRLLAELREQSGDFWVFPGRSDPEKHRTRQAVWKDVKRAAKAFRFDQNIAPHSLRKIYAVDLMQKYGDIDRVRRALNHDRDSTTMIYAMADALLMAKRTRGAARYGRR